jgi:aminopeptidase N
MAHSSRVRRVAATLFVTLLSLAVATPHTYAAPLDSTTRDFDQKHVIVRVTPHIEKGSIDGETTIRFAPLHDGFTVLRLHCQEITVTTALDAAGTALPFKLDDSILSITLPAPLAKDVDAEVTVKYACSPTAGLFFHAPTAASPNTPVEMYSQGEGKDNRRWIPCYDESDDRSTVEIYATVPKKLKTIGNGVLSSSNMEKDGTRTDHWTLDRRIPSYLISLIVGDFATVTADWNGVPLEYNTQVGRETEVCEGCSGTPAMMTFFSEYTGRRYPWPRYAQTTVWDFVYGGMENASATTMNMRLLHGAETRPTYAADGLVAHELAHQWFGDLLTCRTFDHMWLNEGFATYFTDLFFEHRDGPEQFAMERWNSNRGYMNGTPAPHTLGLVKSPRGDIPLELSGGKEYSRGAAILHQLRIELGDDVFKRGIQRYVKDNEDRPVTTEDFRHAMERESGTDLKWFFDQWVYGAGYPVLNVKYEFIENYAPTEAEEHHPTVRVTIEQTQPAGSGQTDTFRISVPLRVGVAPRGVDASGAVRLDVRRRKQIIDVPLRDAKTAPRWIRVGDGGGLFARVNLQQSWWDSAKALAEDPDPTGRLEAVEALLERPIDAAKSFATRLPDEKRAEVRAAMVRGMWATGAARSISPDLAAADKDPRVREALADVLGTTDRAFAAKTLTALATTDASPYVRAAAARSLGRLHAENAFDVCAKLLADVDSHREIVRSGALDGLRALADPRAIPLAKRHLSYDWARGDHHNMRHAALDLLLALAPDDPDTHAAILPLLSDVYHRMRARAAEACGNFGIRAAEPRLREMADRDPDGGAKGAAKAALDRLASKK